jgi:hypothetical protein
VQSFRGRGFERGLDLADLELDRVPARAGVDEVVLAGAGTAVLCLTGMTGPAGTPK